MPRLAKDQRIDPSKPQYMCMFCSYRSNEKLHAGGCPHCGNAWPYGAVGALRALQIISGVVFISLSGFLLWAGTVELQNKLHGEKISWGVVAIPLGVGAILVAGGISFFFGRSWLFRVLFVFFGVTLRRRPPRT
jgi:hypothetical protein